MPQHHGWVLRRLERFQNPGRLVKELGLRESYVYEQEMYNRNGILTRLQEVCVGKHI
jgi:hypothetical protein